MHADRPTSSTSSEERTGDSYRGAHARRGCRKPLRCAREGISVDDNQTRTVLKMVEAEPAADILVEMGPGQLVIAEVEGSNLDRALTQLRSTARKATGRYQNIACKIFVRNQAPVLTRSTFTEEDMGSALYGYFRVASSVNGSSTSTTSPAKLNPSDRIRPGIYSFSARSYEASAPSALARKHCDADFSSLIPAPVRERRLPSGRPAQSPSSHAHGFSVCRACAESRLNCSPDPRPPSILYREVHL